MSPTEFAYRRLLALYPADFRDRFGEEMLQTLRDRIADGATPGVTFWMTVVLDEAPANVHERWAARTPGALPLVRAAVAVLLTALYLAALITAALALPHPQVHGVGFPLALTALLCAAGWMSRATLGVWFRAAR